MAIVGAAMQIAFWTILLPLAIKLIISLFGGMIYGIGVFFFKIMDLLQSIFRKLAGLGGGVGLEGVWYESGDIVTILLSSDVVVDTLISVTIFGLGLVILASIIQMIRLEYTTEGSKNSKEQIFAKAGKSIVMFILIPIVCFVGIRISNYVLMGLDYATSSSGASTVSGSVFTAATADASKVYDSSNINEGLDINNLLGSMFTGDDWNNPIVESSGGGYYIVHFADTFKCSGTTLEEQGGNVRANLANQVAQAFTFLDGRDPMETKPGIPLPEGAHDGTQLEKGDRLSYLRPDSVGYFYNLSNVNYLILFIGCYIGIKTLFTSSMGLIARLYKIGALFVLAPAAIGLQPLDDGNAYKKWRSNFISNVLSCYGIIVALNLYFMLVGVLQTIELWHGSAFWVANKFIQFLFVLTGATMINEISGLVSGAIGAGDISKDGESATKGVSDMAGKVQKFTTQPLMAGSQWAASKFMEGRARHKSLGREEVLDEEGNVVKNKRGKVKTRRVSLASREKDLKNAEKDLAKAEKDFNSKYKEVKKNGIVTGYTDENGKEVKKEDYEEAKSKALGTAKKAVKSAQEGLKGEDVTKQAAKAAHHSIYAGMNANRLGGMAKGAAGGFFAPMKNLIGGDGYLTGKAFADGDEKYMEEMQKKTGLTDEQIKQLTGKEPGKLAGATMFGKANDVVSDKVKGGINKIMPSTNDRLSGYQPIIADQMATKAAQDQMDQAAQSTYDRAGQAIAAGKATQEDIIEQAGGRKARGDAHYRKAKNSEVADLSEFRDLLQKFQNGEASFDDLQTKQKELGKYAKGDGARKNEGITDLINEIVNGIRAQEKAGSKAQQATAASLFDAKFKGVKMEDIIESGDSYNRQHYFNDSEQAAWDAAQDMINRGEAEQKALTSDEYAAARTSGNIDDMVEALKQALGGDDGVNKGFEEAIKKLQEALQNGGIELKDSTDKKLKFDDSSIVKTLQDIKQAIELSANKKDDGDNKVLQDILKQLKQNGKK